MAVGKEDVMRVLEDPALAKIDFWLGGLHIHPRAYRQVADALRYGQIKVVVGDDPKWAQYFAEPGSIKRANGRSEDVPAHTLVIQKTDSLDLNDRALIVHECAHAYVDLSQSVETTILTSEAASYIAQVLFLMANKQEPADDDTTPVGRLFMRVTDLVKEFELNTQRGKVVKWEDYKYVRDMVSAIPQYSAVQPMALVFANKIGTQKAGTTPVKAGAAAAK